MTDVEMMTKGPDPNVPNSATDDSTVAIIVVNWNGWRDTLECLDSVLPLVERGGATIICCDNGSTDDSVQHISNWAKKHFHQTSDPGADTACRASMPAFTLLGTNRNLGYSGGNNVGIRRALQLTSCDFVWLLNNDTTATEGALSSLLLAARDAPHVAAFGSTTVDYFNPSRVQCAGGCRYLPMLTVTRQAMHGWNLEDALASRRDIRLDYIAGSAMFLRTTALREVGLLNEALFLYYEEADYAKRLRSCGHKIAWCRDSIVLHKGAQSTRGRSRRNPTGSWLSEYHENLSTLIYTACHHRKLLPVAATFRFAAKLLLAVVRGPDTVAPLVRAYVDFFRRDRRSSTTPCSPAAPHVLYCGGLAAPRAKTLSRPC